MGRDNLTGSGNSLLLGIKSFRQILLEKKTAIKREIWIVEDRQSGCHSGLQTQWDR